MCLRQFLLDKEVDVNSTDNDRVTALHLAAVRNELAIAQLLIENGAKSTADKNGETPLHWAAARGHSEVGGVQLLSRYQTGLPNPLA